MGFESHGLSHGTPQLIQPSWGARQVKCIQLKSNNRFEFIFANYVIYCHPEEAQLTLEVHYLVQTQ